MRKLISAAVLATGLLVSSGAWAAEDPHSGNALLRTCTDEDFGESMLCLGYVFGVSQGLQAVISQPGKTPTVCIPETQVSIGQRRDIFVKYMKSHPESRHLIGISLYFNAMREAFPCPK
jgi:hypothetical protein